MKFVLGLTAAFVVFVAWAASPVSYASDDNSVSSINGTVRARAGKSYESISTVNGDVRVDSGATVDRAKAINGEVVVEDNARVGEASTVNGSVWIGEDVAIEREASTVNGSIRLGKRARTGGDVSSVSGEIELDGAEVGGTITTYHGDVELSGGARVRGGIHVKKNKDSWWATDDSTPPKVRVCATCVVEGDLRFDREVDLRVESGAQIGNVIRAPAKTR